MGRTRIRTNAERAQLEHDQATLVARALADSDPERLMRDGPATAGGDAVRLRGIPAIGPSVSGAIRGTNPEHQATRSHDPRDRW